MPQIYFSFPDGVFDYVCAECDALCCRGQGFGGSLHREMATLLTLYPSLQSMAVRRRGDVLHFATFRQACQFLDDDRRCRIEREHGKGLKPGVCTLFPFNAFSRIGSVLVVSPHFLCPLRMRVPSAAGEVAGTHSALQAAVLESRLIEEGSWEQAVSPERLLDRHEGPMVLERERRFRDRCGAALAHQAFASVLASMSSSPGALSELTARAAACLGTSVGAPDAPDGVDDVLLAVAPSYRLRFLDVPAESILLALSIGEYLVRDASRLARTTPTAQSVFQYLAAMTPALRLLTRIAALSDQKSARIRIPPFSNVHMTRAAERILAGLVTGQSGLAAAEDATAELPAADRLALLVEVGRAVN